MKRLLATAVLMAAMISCALAQNNFVTPGNSNANGAVQMFMNNSNQAIPSSSANPLPMTMPGITTANPLPVIAVPSPGTVSVVGAATGANTTTQVATLPGVAAKTTYLCGFTASGNGATAAVGTNIAVAGLVGGVTANYQYNFVAGATLANTPTIIAFNPCVPASGVNTAITVTVTGAAGNTVSNIVATGYQF